MLNNGKYDALTVARYIVNYSYNKRYACSNLRLQKLLYFIQVEFLVNTESGQPCFSDDLVAWDFGPVVPSVYREYKKFGSMSIPYVDLYYPKELMNVNSETFYKKYREDEINIEDRKIISSVIEQLKNLSTGKLVDITHSQLPWKEAYYKRVDHIITEASIRGYFNGK